MADQDQDQASGVLTTKIAIRFDEETRARIRAFNGRSGLATRKEIRAFVLEELAESVRNLPPRKPSRRNQTVRQALAELSEAPAAKRVAVPVLSRSIEKRIAASGAVAVQAEPTPAAPEGVCCKCGEPKSAHQRGKFCKISARVKPGSKFELLTEIN